MKVNLTDIGLGHYTKSRASKERAVGSLLYALPSGALVVDWPWGVGIHEEYEVELARNGALG